MGRDKRFVRNAAMLAGAIFTACTATVLGAVPQLINFQGILRDSSGNPVTDGYRSVTFRIYDQADGGTQLWSESRSVTTIDGLFTIILGALNPIPDSVFRGADRYLGLRVSADPSEIMPRLRLVSVGYAYRVSSVDGSSGGTIFGDVSIQSDLSVSGKATIGPRHTNTGVYAFVAGEANVASGNGSTVSGGGGNSTSQGYATVGGGRGNTVGGEAATISGGEFNTASELDATVGGGAHNIASGIATIGGGWHNTASGGVATVGGGGFNTASGLYSTVGGGQGNVASGGMATVGGGGNTASGSGATVGGGQGNIASNLFATVGGGFANTAGGELTTVPGGQGNSASGNYSFAAGHRAKANHAGTFVWADAQDADVNSDMADQFKIRAQSGVRLASEAGSTKPIGLGDHYRDNGIVAWARVTAVGTTGASEFGIENVLQNGIGWYTIVVDVTAASSSELIAVATAAVVAQPTGPNTLRIASVRQTGDYQFDVYINEGDGDPVNNDFLFIATAR